MFPPLPEDIQQPNPKLSAQDVVKIQLDALQNNDLFPGDAGIRAAFEFASPANRRATGSVERFIQLVKNPLYRTMIGFEHAELRPMRFAGSMAQQHVHLHQPDGSVAVYVYTLSKQSKGTFAGCWMVDGVLRIE